jgi:hypothetical protein
MKIYCGGIYMGYKLVHFNFVPEENEQIEAIIKVPKEPRSMIHGVVKDHCNKVVKDAVVKLFKMDNPNNPKALEPITHTFTDEHGQFMFGPLCAHVKYVIKVWINHVNTREIVINADDDDEHDDHCDDDHDSCNKHNHKDRNLD